MGSMHADKTVEERKALRKANGYESTDHHFLGDEQGEYDSLTARGRDMYDDLRWFEGYSHEVALRDARYAYGTKR